LRFIKTVNRALIIFVVVAFVVVVVVVVVNLYLLVVQSQRAPVLPRAHLPQAPDELLQAPEQPAAPGESRGSHAGRPPTHITGVRERGSRQGEGRNVQAIPRHLSPVSILWVNITLGSCK